MIDPDRFDLYMDYRRRWPFGDDQWTVLWTALAFATRL